MARFIPSNFDYQPNDTSALNWDEAPPAPDNFRCVLDWNDADWDKSYGGLVWAPAVRDVLVEYFGNFGTFRTPILLDQAGFRKLCYLVAGDDDLRDYADGKYERQSFIATKRPKNYLPFKFYDNPLAWGCKQFQLREAQQQRQSMLDTLPGYVSVLKESRIEELSEDDLFIDEAGQLVKTNDQVQMVNCSEKELNGTIGTVFCRERDLCLSHVNVYMTSSSCRRSFSCLPIHKLRKFIPSGTNVPLGPPKSPEHVVDWSRMPPERNNHVDQEKAGKKFALGDLSKDVKQHIASFLLLFDVERNLRYACRDSFWNFTKPPPDNLEYDFVYFWVSNVPRGSSHLNQQWHGVAHTTSDVVVAIWNHDWRGEQIFITLKFVKFDRNHPIVPLFRYSVGGRSVVYPAYFDPLGCHYGGVQQASDVGLDSSTIWLDGRDDPDQIKEHCTVFRHCKDWTPREPRIQLRHIETRLKRCGHCGRVRSLCRCERRITRPDVNEYLIYYSPEWFDDSDDFAFSAPSDSWDKSVIIFSESAL